jgi:ParB family transcriptional regulator, chromosome partitioning protein
LLGGNRERARGEGEEEQLVQLALTALRPGKYQPRTRMDQASLRELADSIKARGVIQPVIVRPVAGGQYEILAGERRWRAAQIAGLDKVPAVVREVADEAALGIGLIENIQREDLNPLEEAQGLKRLIDEFRLTHEEVAGAVGRSRAGVTNLLRLLELVAPVQEMLLEGKLDMGHARALLALSPARQVEVAQQVVSRQLSVRETERLVQQATAAPAVRQAAVKLDADSRRLQEELAESLGAAVQLKPRSPSKGAVVIEYSSLDELQGLVKRLLRR